MGRYLVTGGCGFIGSHLVEYLLEEGHEVTVLDDLSTGKAENLPAAAALIVGDVADPQAVAEAMLGQDACFHLAAIASVEQSRENWSRTHRVNLSGTVNVFDAARLARTDGPIPVVFASSAAVYGDGGGGSGGGESGPPVPLAEDRPLFPISAYGADKLGCELHAAVAAQLHGIPVTGFRLFNAYGPGQDPNSPYSGVISIFADRIARRQPITVFGDGEQTRDFVYVGDIIQYLVAAINRPRSERLIFNICSGRTTSITHVAEVLGELTGTTALIEHAPAREGDIRFSVGDPRRLMTEFGFACDTSLRDGLRKTLRWLGVDLV